MFRTKTPRISEQGRREAKMRKLCAEVCLKFVGNDEFYGRPFSFEPWQEKNVWNPIFGCGTFDKATGTFHRKYRRALIGLERGIGKTVNACGLLLTEATMNPVFNGQYGLIADSEDNAKNAFQVLTAMVRTSPEMDRIWECYKKEIRNRETGAWIRTFPNKVGAVQGWHFNFVICDEVHVYRDDSIWKAVTSGQRGIPNALAIAITTASESREGFLWDWFCRLRKGEDPACYCYWVGIDEDDDPKNRKCWRKVMVSPRVTMAALEDQLMNLGWRDFMRYQLNFFPRDRYEEPFVEAENVDACQEIDVPLDFDEWFAVGVDAAPSGDDTAVVAAQQKRDGTWAFKEWVWPGQRADFNDLADVLDQLALEPGNPTIVIDPNRLKLVKDWLWNERGIDLFDFPQTPKAMCPASELLRRSVRMHQAAFHSVPTLAKHLKNAVAVESKAYGDRISSTGHGPGSARIDAAVAAAMAMSYYDGNVDDHTGSYAILSIPM